jgi:hypothetical protein
VAEKFKKLGDKYARRTKQSGAGIENGDVYTTFPYTIECKQRNTKDVTVRIDVWEKNKADIPLNSTKLPLLFLENERGKRFAILEADDFFELLKRAKTS